MFPRRAALPLIDCDEYIQFEFQPETSFHKSFVPWVCIDTHTSVICVDKYGAPHLVASVA